MEQQLKSRESIGNFYHLGRHLGKPGYYGYAREAVKRGTNQKFAVKVVSQSKMSSIRNRAMFRREMKMLKELDHPNVIKGYEMFEDKKATYLVMEMCSGGELFDRIEAKTREGLRYSEMDAANIIRQICQGIGYLHANNIAHCDIKPDNILFKSKDSSELKIIDFNLSKYVQPLKYETAMTGTPYYVAPEVIQGRYTYHCDMWSLGVIMFMLLFGFPPFDGETDEEILERISEGFKHAEEDGYGPWFPTNIPISNEAKSLLRGLLEIDPVQRLAANEALQHPWLNGQAPSLPVLTTVLSNLGNFLSSHHFKLALLSFLSDADRFSDAELHQFRTLFATLDSNGDGIITLGEMEFAMQRAGISALHVQRLFSRADLDGDGVLHYKDLLLAFIHNRLVQKQERLLSLFQELDADGNGYLSERDISRVVSPLTDTKRVIAEIDEDGDGRINYNEFIRMFTKRDDTPPPSHPALTRLVTSPMPHSLIPSAHVTKYNTSGSPASTNRISIVAKI